MNVLAILQSAVGLAVMGAALAGEPKGQTVPARIAFLSGDATCATNNGLRALRDGLRALGYRNGENVTIECRTAEGRYERLGDLADELTRLHPKVLVAAAAPASLAAKRATGTIPIISVYTADPVELGLVKSLARPGTNVTGISALASDHAAKSLQLLKEMAPRTARVGVLGHASNPTYAIYQRELELGARAMGLTLDYAGVEAPGEIEAALSAMKRRGVDAVFVMHQPLTYVNRERIVGHMAQLRLPAIFGSREAVELGGLMSYAVNVEETFRRAAIFVDKVLRGATPSDLPVEQPAKFELVVNVKAARAIDLTIPAPLLLQADRVVE